MNKAYIRTLGRIAGHRSLSTGYREMTVSWGEGNTRIDVVPGQFFTLLPRPYPHTLLRRPFAYSGVDDEGFSFIYEIRGKATRDFAQMQIGEEIDAIGPLGMGFPAPPEGLRPVLIAGGIGIGPIYYLAKSLAADGLNPLVVLGGRRADLIPDLTWPKDAELRICTDDGSAGISGTAIDGINADDVVNGIFYSCGPIAMMAAVHRLALEGERPSWVSMEEMMACGVGACQGCAVPVVNREDPSEPAYRRACAEGPVFDSREIKW